MANEAAPDTYEPVPARRCGPEPPWAVGVWIGWILGPGSLLGLILLIWTSTGGDPEPADGLGIFSIAPLQFVSALLTFGMLVSPGKFRRVPEFWLLVVYWISFIALVLGPLKFMRFCKPAIFLAAVAFPIMGGLRLVVHRCRRGPKPTAV